MLWLWNLGKIAHSLTTQAIKSSWKEEMRDLRWADCSGDASKGAGANKEAWQQVKHMRVVTSGRNWSTAESVTRPTGRKMQNKTGSTVFMTQYWPPTQGKMTWMHSQVGFLLRHRNWRSPAAMASSIRTGKTIMLLLAINHFNKTFTSKKKKKCAAWLEGITYCIFFIWMWLIQMRFGSVCI